MIRRVAPSLVALSALAMLAAPPPAAANGSADLRVREFPMISPTSLAMRSQWVVARAAHDDDDDDDDTDTDRDTTRDSFGEGVETLEIDALLREQLSESDALGQRRGLDEKVVLNISLGIGIDGGQPSQNRGPDNPPALLSGESLDERVNYARLRSYGFGDLVIGTNGLGTSSLRSYLATSYRFNRPIRRQSTAIPTVFDGDFGDYIVRSAWIDIDDVFERRWLKPVYLRVGRQTKFGVAVAHFTGITVGYKTRAVRVATFVGTRSSPYAFNEATPLADPDLDGGGLMTGSEVTLDLAELRRIPVVLALSNLRFDDSSYFDASAALRFGRNSLLRAQLRTADGKPAQESLRLRSRVTKVTTVSAELDNRHANDWVYDLLLAAQPTAASDPRNYLNLGPPRPRARATVRAGTVLLRNIDLLLSAAAALEYARNAKFAPSSFRSSYLELGAALEVRLRRNLRLGVAGSGRNYKRDREDLNDVSEAPDPLFEDTGALGEKSFIEGGGFAQYSLGARRFSARTELYARRFRYRSPYIDPGDEKADLRSGGRFSIDGWASKQVRLRLEYDLSLSKLRYAPELDGVKSLRVSLEGAF